MNVLNLVLVMWCGLCLLRMCMCMVSVVLNVIVLKVWCMRELVKCLLMRWCLNLVGLFVWMRYGCLEMLMIVCVNVLLRGIRVLLYCVMFDLLFSVLRMV